MAGQDFSLSFIILLFLGLVLWVAVRQQKLSEEVQRLRTALEKLTEEGLPPASAARPPIARAVVAAAPTPANRVVDAAVEPPKPLSPAPPERTVTGAAQPPMTPSPPQADGEGQGFEKMFTTRWLVWLGALTLALSGLFLARYAVENGILGPGPRMGLTGLLGLALMGAGEWLSRRPMARALGFLKPDQVPVALVAAGLSVLFAAIYASHAVHGLITPGATFALLAVTSLAGFPLALRHGPFVALLAYAGGLLLPLLLGNGQSLGDAAWVAVLLASLYGVAARLGRGWLLLVGGFFHWLLTGSMIFDLPDAESARLAYWVVSGLALLPLLLLALVERGRWRLRRQFERACLVMAVLTAMELLLIPILTDMPLAVWVATGLMAALSGWLGRRGPLCLMLWPIAAGTVLLNGLWALVSEQGNLAPLLPLVLVHLGLTLAGVRWVRRPLIVALSGAVVPAVLALAALRLLWLEERTFAILPLAVLLLALAGLALGWPTVRARLASLSRAPMRAGPALTLYAAMGLLLLGVMPAFWLEGAALTLAVAPLIPLGVVLAQMMAAKNLLRATGLLTGTVLARFMLNGAVLDYPLQGLLHWPVWAMGGSAALIYLASRLARKEQGTSAADGLLVSALVLAVAAASLEIRVLTNGTLHSQDRVDLLEVALRGVVWLVAGLGALMPGRGRWVRGFGVGMTGLALLHIFALQVLALNPLWSGAAVGPWPLLNLLLLAYLLPACMLLLVRRRLLSHLPIRRVVIDAPALLLLLTYALLAVRQLFHGNIISIAVAGWPSDWEMYAYSGVGLLAAAGLILLGIRTGRADIRYTAMAVLLGTVAKVFLLDMSGLDGVPRILSFLGLGLSLIGVGWVYQRFVFPRSGADRSLAD
ncbi:MULTISPECIES: DUF2339 domain-containing protein [unclassified Azospirillum]|uniref:DUF2339 domain-containing protein n=1 Tax=unclassified Azospirillum TaxID=2630922 RepID=UPI000B6FF3C6|nr:MULTISPECIES: DUF2339 domain-containing protein [unclassified Azospirillum]SNS25010.1 Uncharacterized membrane protein [Azospirillum sp. RU38E]SNS43460.1 Uncharacterized membrane protein [Azospirillum sp. RU37A]